MSIAACDVLLRQRGGTVVGIAAGPDVGKTTLIATMYELLHRRRMSSFGFAGSETLRGYEERCHLARLSSYASRPDTRRTPVGVGLEFTHLRIATSGGMRDVLFADRSGEHFQAILSRPAEVKEFAELHRSDAIVLLVDLARLVTDTHVTVSGVRRLFLAMDQGGVLEGKTVTLVGTKADVAMSSPRSTKAAREMTTLADELDRRASGRFSIGRHIIACRARSGSAVIGEGVEQLLAALLAGGPSRPRRVDDAWPPRPSELDLLMRGYRGARS
ncbi:MAG: hypothetical protein KIT82_18685 [Bradyrhizobium sp.]|nr:hypothetical protein [Bradyrhizobium sp.]